MACGRALGHRTPIDNTIYGLCIVLLPFRVARLTVK
jgi:hypothetical protein